MQNAHVNHKMVRHKMGKPSCFVQSESKKEIKRLCNEQKIDLILLEDLSEVISQHSGSGRRVGIDYEISECIDRFISRENA